MNLQGNTVLITGGSSGIGRALAREFHKRNNRVIVCGRDRDRLEDVARELPGVETRSFDMCQAGATETFATQLGADFPGLNILVNNAGVQSQCDFRSGSDLSGMIRTEIDSNLTSHLVLTALLMPLLLRQADAAVVNVTSALAIAPKRSAPVYCATKAAMRSFTRTLRYQLEGSHVRVFDLIPALVRTAMTADRGARHMLTPEELARAAIAGMAADRSEIVVERARLLLWIHRVWPGLAYRILRDG